MVAAVDNDEFCKEVTSALVRLGVPRRFSNLAAKKLASVRPVRPAERSLEGHELSKICMTINEAARELNISRTTAYTWLRQGRLQLAIFPGTRKPILRIKGMTVVSRESVEMLKQLPPE